jgi:hypothetical protein
MLVYTTPLFLPLWALGGFTMTMPQYLLGPASATTAVLLVSTLLILAHLMDYRQAGDRLARRFLGFLDALPSRSWAAIPWMMTVTFSLGFLLLPHTVQLPLLDNLLLPNAVGSAALLMAFSGFDLFLWTALFSEGTRQNAEYLEHPLRSMLSTEFRPWLVRFAAYPLLLAALNAFFMAYGLGLFPQFLLWAGFLFVASRQYFLLKNLFFGVTPAP